MPREAAPILDEAPATSAQEPPAPMGAGATLRAAGRHRGRARPHSPVPPVLAPFTAPRGEGREVTMTGSVGTQHCSPVQAHGNLVAAQSTSKARTPGTPPNKPCCAGRQEPPGQPGGSGQPAQPRKARPHVSMWGKQEAHAYTPGTSAALPGLQKAPEHPWGGSRAPQGSRALVIPCMASKSSFPPGIVCLRPVGAAARGRGRLGGTLPSSPRSRPGP